MTWLHYYACLQTKCLLPWEKLCGCFFPLHCLLFSFCCRLAGRALLLIRSALQCGARMLQNMAGADFFVLSSACLSKPSTFVCSYLNASVFV